MSVERGKQRALVDKIMAGVADQSDAVEDEAAGKLRRNDDGVQSQGEMQAEAEMVIGGRRRH